MNSRLVSAVATAALLSVTPRADAQVTSFELSFAGQQTSVDSALAVDRGMSASGLGVQLAMDLVFKKYFSTSFELGTLFYGDRREFSQSVICIPNCSGGSRTSTISSAAFGMAAGFRTPRLRLGRSSSWLSARVGTIKLVASRTIGGCSDCIKQDLGLTAGGYVEYGIGTRLGKRVEGMTASIGRRVFLSDASNFKPSIVFQVGMSLEPR